MRMTLRRFNSAKKEGFSLMLGGNSFLRPTPCNADRRADRATADQLKDRGCQCRVHQTRFVTIRTLCLSLHARRKPGRSDRRLRLDWPGDRPKRRRPPRDPCARTARVRARSDGSFHPAPILLRATPHQNRCVGLRPRPETDEWKQQPGATLPLCAQPRPPRPTFPQRKEHGQGCSAPETPADLIPRLVEPASQPHFYPDRRRLAPGDRSPSDSRAKVLWRALVRSAPRQISIRQSSEPSQGQHAPPPALVRWPPPSPHPHALSARRFCPGR